MFLLAALGLAVSAQEPQEPEMSFSDVVIVWPDKFARWRETRWWVGMELLFPPGIPMDDGLANKNFRSIALQVKSIIACDERATLGRKRLEVACHIEDIALQSTSVDRWKKEKDKQLVQDVLDDIDAALTGARLELQVNERGAITNVGIEGLDTSNNRLRTRAENLRQILARLVYPFHMKLPKNGVKEGHWVEYDSDLMTMPSGFTNQGSSMIVHYMNFYKGYLLVQDIGAGMLITSPLQRAQDLGIGDAGFDDPTFDDDDDDQAPEIAREEPTQLAQLGNYKLHLDGVSIYNIDNGIMEERVWAMHGRPNAASATNNLRLHYAGRIRLLGDDDKPDLGPTRQIAYPNVTMAGLPDWTPVDPEMQDTLSAPLPPPPPMSKKKKK